MFTAVRAGIVSPGTHRWGGGLKRCAFLSVSILSVFPGVLTLGQME